MLAFEPDEEMFSLLRRAAPANVTVYNYALSNASGVRQFRVPVEGDTPIVTLGSLANVAGPSVVREVMTRVLDNWMAMDIGFIKIDVEGHEVEVLAGGRQLLERHRPVVLAEANDPDAVARLEEFFKPMGYVGFFVIDGATHSMEDFGPSLQDRAELERPVPRRSMRFVNNFFFAPADEVAALRLRVAAKLRALS